MGSWTTRPSFSTIFFFFVFVVSVIFHCHLRLALVPAPWASRGLVVLGPRRLPQGGMWTINSQGRLGNQMGQYATLYALLDWFRARHPAPVFVVTSDDMAWCRRNINSSLGDVVFAGNGRQGSPAKDFALLMQCNHTVFTVGTFGVWAAYLAGGDAVYLANFTLPHSRFRTIFKPQAAFLPQWVGIAANLGPAGENSP
ncbi:PREDICTED: galactoside 2-alpha-L-fucosyltransferase 2-like [Myotis davidii]|uniref:galactoside 2-alpha-L-fucosyltransferase 2-like n=1 Tax=Myotis davidii TaxID=225400 RepID=UPI0007673C08|nr:PREDICTED: galactoside 2-alpha-L-fucosyltransferase 2-like [Myotis davidii]